MNIVKVAIRELDPNPMLFNTNIQGLKYGDFVNCETRFGIRTGQVLSYVEDPEGVVANWAFQKVDVNALFEAKRDNIFVEAIDKVIKEKAEAQHEEPSTPDLSKGIECHELHRVYHYRDGSVAYYSDIKAIAISKSGNHRLKTVDKDGKVKLHIVAPGWKSIDITPKGDDWTF